MTTAPHLPGGPTTVQTARPAHQPPRRGAPPARQGRPGTWPAEGLSRSRSHGAQLETWRSGSAETERQQCREQQRCYHDEAAAQRRRLPRPPGTQGRQQSSQRPPSQRRFNFPHTPSTSLQHLDKEIFIATSTSKFAKIPAKIVHIKNK